jgi:hypothetical protein
MRVLLRLLRPRDKYVAGTFNPPQLRSEFSSLVWGKQRQDVNLKGWVEMADIYKFSDRVVEIGERLADTADAVRGKGNRKGRGATRWLVLPAAGAGLFALGASGSFRRQAKEVMDQARERASDLPEDLAGRVQQATGAKSSRSKTAPSRSSSQRRKTTAGR